MSLTRVKNITADTVISTTTQNQLRIENTAANSLGSYMKIRDGNSTAGQHTWIGRSTHDTYIYSNNNDLGMKITNAGQITMPNQPSFEAWKNNGSVAPGDTMIFNGTDHNIGNMYNTSNGRGTVTVPGRYVVSVFVMNENNAAYVNRYYKIQKNGTMHKIVYNSNPNVTHHHWNFFGILELAANDYIDIVSDGVGIYGNDKKYTTFCMHLLS